MSSPSPSIETTLTDEIEAAVRLLKEERDTWKEMAQLYQKAFETQTAVLQKLQATCFATQAELENERMEKSSFKFRAPTSETFYRNDDSGSADSIDGDAREDSCFGSAIISKYQTQMSWPSSTRAWSHVWFCGDDLASKLGHRTALREIEHLLQGPLTPETRIECLLLKSNVMRTSDCLYDALAACSEALELCDRLQELRSYLPQIQYERGICYIQLHMIQHARDCFSKAYEDDHWLSSTISALQKSCEEQLQPDRRAGFEAHRTIDEAQLAQLDGGIISSRRTSSYISLHASKAKRLSLPPRWTTARSKSGGVN